MVVGPVGSMMALDHPQNEHGGCYLEVTRYRGHEYIYLIYII